MRNKTVFGILAVLFIVPAMAIENYYCSAKMPAGRMRIQGDLSNPGKINVVFDNLERNQTYIGTLEVLDNTVGALLAKGTLLAYEKHAATSVSIIGSLASKYDGVFDLQLYASGDRRFEYGFGNPLKCKKQ